MATETFGHVAKSDDGKFFGKVLRIDGIATLLLGVVTIIESAWLPTLMGAGTTPLYLVLGLACALMGAGLFWLSTRSIGRRTMVTVLGLAVLVCIDGLLLLFGNWVTFTTAGFWIVVAITDAVAALAVAYFIGLRRA